MKRRISILLAVGVIWCGLGAGEVASLSDMFKTGKGLVDSDGDGLADRFAFHIVIPDQPTAEEAAAAADIAGRANLESLAADFDLVLGESQYLKLKPSGSVILIGSRLGSIKRWLLKEKSLAALTPEQGVVAVLSEPGLQGLALVAGSEEALLKTARAFFLRWPYFWEIWGRENGSTYEKLLSDIETFLGKEDAAGAAISFPRAVYEFPSIETPHEALKRLSFGNGQVKELGIEIALAAGPAAVEKAAKSLRDLAADRNWGRRTETLSYPGCALLTFRLTGGRTAPIEVSLPRTGFPKRLLTPAYKTPPRAEAKGKEFDLLGLFTSKGALGDSDLDGIPDNIETSIVVPRSAVLRALPDLTTRLALSSAGASFPLVYLDKEVENPKSLSAPLLVGESTLVLDLKKTGRFKPSSLGPGQAEAVVIPAAFHKSAALVLSGADTAGLEALLSYLGRTFPYLKDYGKGHAQLSDVSSALEKFLSGENGAAEAFFRAQLKQAVETLKGKDLESLEVNLLLPKDDPAFAREAENLLKTALNPRKVDLIQASNHSAKVLFDKSKDFTWEADEAEALIRKTIGGLPAVPGSVRIEAGLSESPDMRRVLADRFQKAVRAMGAGTVEVEVRSAYKQGFFWLLEDVLPRLKAARPDRVVVRWAVEREDLARMKRFYSEPTRWLQELYPADELLARELGLPLDKIEFLSTEEPRPVYRVSAYDAQGKLTFEQDFDPCVREMPYLRALPEWGTVKVATGWLAIESDGREVLRAQVQTDLERFWSFYQDEVLGPVYTTILKKTGNAPAFSKQPFFKKLSIELWASEPDFRLGLDEERVSSLEAMHDEIYFDTLDFLRGITDIDQAGESLPEDSSRFSAPGNVMPVIHPSTEGQAPRVRVTFEEDKAASPELELKWKEAGHEALSRKVVFPVLKPKSMSVPRLVYDSRLGRLRNLTVAVEFDKEEAYTQVIDILDSLRSPEAAGSKGSTLTFPGLDTVTLRLRFKELEKEETLTVFGPEPEPQPAATEKQAGAPSVTPGVGSIAAERTGSVVPSGVLSPEMVWDAVRKLEATGKVAAYAAGTSYEGRQIPVLEVRTPLDRYVSVPRLVTFKPTLYMSGRQHANEVSSTTYILKLAEKLALDPAAAAFARKINFVLHPVENPDGAALAFDLQKLTPYHSLHAGRYSALGLEIGYQTDAANPILPEAKVRRDINAEWLPDIYLNLHGYPSHEWVQAFSDYSPYLFREYWIPKGWFAYFQAVTNPFYRPWREAAAALEKTIESEMQARADIRESDRRFYDRYQRWATRWQPHLDPLELHGGLNLFVNRTSSREVKPVGRAKTTYVEETPELMDETAQNGWFDFLTEQGLTYLSAHIKYLAAAAFDILRLEEEVGDRVRIQFFRNRPGTTPEEARKK